MWRWRGCALASVESADRLALAEAPALLGLECTVRIGGDKAIARVWFGCRADSKRQSQRCSLAGSYYGDRRDASAAHESSYPAHKARSHRHRN
jgi:hypothetical protein